MRSAARFSTVCALRAAPFDASEVLPEPAWPRGHTSPTTAITMFAGT